MKSNLLTPFEHLPFFTLEGFKQMLASDKDETQRARELVSEWSRQGKLIRLKKGVYMTKRFYEFHQGELGFLPMVSAVLEPHSYLSVEYILQRAGVLTEITYSVSAITAKNTKTIQNPAGTFTYRHLKPALYTGFSTQVYFGVYYYEASVAKALFDYLYLRPLPRRFRTVQLNLAEDLRLNVDEFSSDTQLEFENYVITCESEKMAFIFENFKRHVWRP